MQYIIARKIKGKWYGLAGCNLGPQSCLAFADDIFAAHGLNQWTDKTLNVCWGRSLEAQKNYAGRVANFQDLTPLD